MRAKEEVWNRVVVVVDVVVVVVVVFFPLLLNLSSPQRPAPSCPGCSGSGSGSGFGCAVVRVAHRATTVQ